MSVTSANLDYEQAGELKIGQVGIANLRIRTLDVDQLVREMRERVERAPKLFGRADPRSARARCPRPGCVSGRRNRR